MIPLSGSWTIYPLREPAAIQINLLGKAIATVREHNITACISASCRTDFPAGCANKALDNRRSLSKT